MNLVLIRFSFVFYCFLSVFCLFFLLFSFGFLFVLFCSVFCFVFCFFCLVLPPESSAKGHRYFLSEDQCRQSRAVFSIFSLLKARAPSDLSLSVRSGRARNLWTATKQVPRARIWTRISESGIVFHGDSENRSPEADFGLPGAENPTFSIFRFF